MYNEPLMEHCKTLRNVGTIENAEGVGEVGQQISITFRSFVLPPDAKDDYPPANPFSLRLPPGTEVGKIVDRIFAEKVNQIGMVVINGKVAERNVLLAEGDRVDAYALLSGD